MSFYIEIDRNDKKTTYLVQSFNMASKGFWGTKPDPTSTEVTLKYDTYSYSGVHVTIPVCYEEFKKILLESQASRTIPSFKIG